MTYSTYDVRERAVRAVVEDGMAVTDVAKAYHTHRATVHRWLSRYHGQGGNRGLIRRPVSGRPRALSELKGEDLRTIVLQPASAFGYETDFWTCSRVCQVLYEQYQVQVSRWTLWRRLRETKLSYHKPEPQYMEACEAERQRWVAEELPVILETVKRHRAVLYFEDEANVSLGAILARTWGPEGKRIKQKTTGARGSVSAMSAVRKRGELLFTLLDKRIASDEVIHFLGQILEHHKRRHVVVVMDNAKPHTSKKTQAFVDSQPRLHVFHLPRYSPDWNPDEKIWNHLKHQELKGHRAKTKQEMKELAERKLTDMANNPSKIRGIFLRCCVAELLH
jgi:transposase